MTAALSTRPISVDDYLVGERTARQKHEYVAGRVYVMSGGTNTHNDIAMSFGISAGLRLRGKPCKPCNFDVKVRIRSGADTWFYYPDAMIVCDANPAEDHFQDRPVVVVEVLSNSTRRIDEGEKLDAYLTIPTLSAYLLIDTQAPRIVAHERTHEGFVTREYDGMAAIVPLPVVGIELPLAELYERVDFAAAVAEERDPNGA